MPSPRTIENMSVLLDPRSVAVVGASDHGDKPGARLIAKLAGSSFAGALYGINPRKLELPGVRWAPSVDALPETPELACIALPASAAVESFEQLAERGLRAAVVYSSGFGEAGADGVALERRLVDVATANGIAVCGPNTAGVLSTRTAFTGSFSHALDRGMPDPGAVMVITQSGAVGGMVLTHLRARGIGVSSWISVGNGAMLDVADYLELAASDPDTSVVALFLEGLRDGASFLAAAHRCVAAGKQVVVLKAGRSELGAKAALSHTGKLAGADAVYDGVFRQAGLLRVDTVRELVDLCQLLSFAALPKARRGAVVSVSGAGCTLLADEYARAGLALADFTSGTKDRIHEVLPGYSQQGNPVDLTGSALERLERLEAVVRAVTTDPGVDFVTLCFATNARPDIAAAVSKGWDRRVPLAVVQTIADADAVELHESLVRLRVPVFRDMADAVRAFAKADGTVDAIATSHAADTRGWLAPSDALIWAAEQGLPTATGVVAATSDEAASLVADWPGPVVVKVDHPEVLHKTDVGGVKTGVAVAEVSAACKAIQESVTAHGIPFAPRGRFVVQPQIPDGVEVLVGLTTDPTFGRVLTVGIGGTAVELVGEVASRVLPVSTQDIRSAIGQTKLGKLLSDGRQGARDVAALVAVVAAFAAAVEADPSVSEGELNPVIVAAPGQGATVVDARIRRAGHLVPEDRLRAPIGRKPQ
jgi:acetate---CoA ligase (ADP-forming)